MSDRTFQILFSDRPPVRRTAPTWYVARQEAQAEFGAAMVECVMIDDATLAKEREAAGRMRG